MRTELTTLRARNSQLESELAMTAGAQATLSKQTLELTGENSQLKEELSFLQKLVSDTNKQVGLAIQRLTVEPERDDAWHYSVLVVRGGTPRDEFEGIARAAGDGAARAHGRRRGASRRRDAAGRAAGAGVSAEAQIQVLSAA